MLFDGPPDQQASLIPDSSSRVADRWDTTGIDPYLVCYYRGTKKTVTLHAKAVKECRAGGKRFAAWCR